ncbi:hypothetical protein J4E90_006109 [Alternaria incomplexa]|uniref:uncharacterized protein n=1 Tax=Alternaria incomplexa TaxID=1187928 RepID=UPI0022205CB0|nr:uncharacterized protein J4E90_006109 [Alternaria incomplexa]KAI4912703.1 hypothetical protein J4E90_006109 [Alternaria incomplexa]
MIANDNKHWDENSERRAYNDRISRMRKIEYPMLEDLTYLDHGGTTLASKSLLDSFCEEMQSTLLANPHSDSSNPSVTAVMVEQTRLAVLKMFNADPVHFDVVFTANATGAIKLVTEGFSGYEEGFDYCYHRNSHTSLVGVRELANPLVSTTPIDLSNHLFAPDFISLSFYKIFGFPDLGALIVRKAAGHVFDHRKYFGGGTTEMTTCLGESWVARKNSSLHARLEDGTIAFRNILALKCAIMTHRALFGGLEEVSTHARWLASILHDRLTSMTHYNGALVCQVYKSRETHYQDSQRQGPTIAFNIQRSNGAYIGPWHVGAFLRASKIHVRTGNVCNPAGMACALGVEAGWIRGAFDAGLRCNTEADVVDGVPFGIVRVTLGAMSTLEDVETLVSCLSRNVVERRGPLQETAQVRDKSKEWVEESRSPSAVSEMTTTRIDPPFLGQRERTTTLKTPRSLISWLRRRKRLYPRFHGGRHIG